MRFQRLASMDLNQGCYTPNMLQEPKSSAKIFLPLHVKQTGFMKYVILYTLLITVAITSCQNQASQEDINQDERFGQSDGQGISTQDIRNPQSASGKETDTANLPEISFNKEEHDFGTIQEGEKVSYKFEFTNTGNSDLIISNALASCGCTVPKYPKEPIPPGETRKISVTFDSDGKVGQQRKAIGVLANTQPNMNQVHIVADVQKAKK